MDHDLMSYEVAVHQMHSAEERDMGALSVAWSPMSHQWSSGPLPSHALPLAADPPAAAAAGDGPICDRVYHRSHDLFGAVYAQLRPVLGVYSR